MTDWLWQKMEHADQKKKVLEARKNKKFRKEEKDKRFITSYRKVCFQLFTKNFN